MEKRDRFIKTIQDEARARGIPFKIDKGRGKGGHARLWFGDKVVTLPSREIDPVTGRKIRKALGID